MVLAWACKKLCSYIAYQHLDLQVQDTMTIQVLAGMAMEDTLQYALVAEHLLKLQCYQFLVVAIEDSRILMVSLKAFTSPEEPNHEPIVLEDTPNRVGMVVVPSSQAV